MASKLIFAFILLILLLLVAFDAYSYGIALKRTPLLISNPLLVIQAQYQFAKNPAIIKSNCPDITQFRSESPYREYADIPLEEWNQCILATAPSALVRDSCIESETTANDLLNQVNSQNELVLGLEKYGILFSPMPTYQKFSDFADNNVCVRAVNGFTQSKGIELDFVPSKVLNVDRFVVRLSDLTPEQIVESTELKVGKNVWDIQMSSLFILAGVFVILTLFYTVFSNLRGNDSGD